MTSAGLLVIRVAFMSFSFLQYLKSWMPRGGPERSQPTGVTLQRVEDPSDKLIESSVALFLDLMKDDAALLSLCGGDLSIAPIQIAAELRAGALGGEFYTATDSSGDLLGYALTMPPGTELFSTEEQRQLGFYDFMNKLSDEGKKYYETTMVEYRDWADKTIAPVTGIGSWWIYLLMIRRDQQGKGIGSSLVRLIRDKAAKNDEALGLATSNSINVEIYKKMGFELRGHMAVPSPWKEWDAWLFTMETKTNASS